MGSIFLESENFGFGNDSFADLDACNFSAEKTEKTIAPQSTKNFSKISEKKFSPKKEIILLNGISRQESLKNILSSMKPSFLQRDGNGEKIRQIFLENTSEDPMILLRKGEQSFLVGTGFSDIFHVGKNFGAFPDLRLPFSEKSRLQWWILLNENIDIDRVLLICDVLDFPVIFSTKNIIAKIRENASENILEKMHFFEIFSNNSFTQTIGSMEFVAVKYEHKNILGFRSGESIFAYEKMILPEYVTAISDNYSLITRNGDIFQEKILQKNFSVGEILSFIGKEIFTESMKFTFDTFYRDENSIGTVSGYTFSDRKTLAQSGIVMFTLEEDVNFRAISGHIFIDSRGFVYAHEMMKIHKEIIKAVRLTYEQTIEKNPQIERSELAQILRSEIAKYCFVLTGRTPIIMPIILEKKHF